VRQLEPGPLVPDQKFARPDEQRADPLSATGEPRCIIIESEPFSPSALMFIEEIVMSGPA
jgi:hypothetical protein